MPDQIWQAARAGQQRSPDDSHQESDQATRQTEEIPFWEWVIAALGLVLVLGSLGYLGYEAMQGGTEPPSIQLRVDSIVPLSDTYLVEVLVVNRGSATAAGLTIEGELRDSAGPVETSETTIDYVPAHSQRTGGLFFTQDPRAFDLHLRAKGYQAP